VAREHAGAALRRESESALAKAFEKTRRWSILATTGQGLEERHYWNTGNVDLLPRTPGQVKGSERVKSAHLPSYPGES